MLRQTIAAICGMLICSAAVAQNMGAADIRAQLVPQRFTTLSAELGVKIAHIHVREGERFKAGQALVSFDCSLQEAQLEKAKAQVFAAQSTFEGNQRLVKFNAIGDVELRNSEAELLKARADQSYLQATVNKCEIAAPYGGRAGEWRAREQQFVQPGQPILEIVDDSQLELEFILPTVAVVNMRAAAKFRVLIEDSKKSYSARFVRAGAKADPVSQTTKVIAVLEGYHPELMAGMSGRIFINQAEAK
ncbi:efflux RND transporter periplasmic adaptor subunit [Limnohabitans sp.]